MGTAENTELNTVRGKGRKITLIETLRRKNGREDIHLLSNRIRGRENQQSEPEHHLIRVPNIVSTNTNQPDARATTN